jgi:hypothetical protein
MSELIQSSSNGILFRNRYLATASALALMAYVSSASASSAQGDDRTTVWIELGGQMEQMQEVSSPFTAPFMSTPAGPYDPASLISNQRPPRLGFGLEGSLSLQPQGSDWVFTASVRYSRSHLNRHDHQQSPSAYAIRRNGSHISRYAAAFDDVKVVHDESHTILDFSAGKDLGIGLFGREGDSTISAGVRFAQFSEKSDMTIRARPVVNIVAPNIYRGFPTFFNYTMMAQASRSFRGIGPSLSWNVSAPLVGNKDNGELTLDWGVNGAVLFGRQKAKTNHTTQAYHLPFTSYGYYAYNYYTKVYQHAKQSVRSRSVVVPDVGGFAGVSVKYPNLKVSLGYRADFFFGAVDTGIDDRHTKNLGFNGPFATVSIGFP